MGFTKLKPAPVPYPNGGGLAAMNKRQSSAQKLEVEALQKQHEAELARLKEKHVNENKPQMPQMKKAAKKNG